MLGLRRWNPALQHFTTLFSSCIVSSVMPIIKSAIKRVRQQAKRRSRNLQVKRAIHNDIRTFTDAATAGDAKATATALVAAISEIDRAVKKGTLHRNTAARRKSGLQKRANAVVSAEPAANAAAKPVTKAKTKPATKPKKAPTKAKAAK